MNDPSSGVPQALLPHIHLLSNFKFPIQSHMSVDTIVDYLLQAPNITRHSAPMNWTFLDAPTDGAILLVWQPGQLGTQFASDGYLWGDPESAFSLNAKDCIPANRIPVTAAQQQMLNTRRFLQSAGQLVRKEFMLHDRNNWPTINLPGGQMPPSYPQQGGMYPSNSMSQAGRGAPPGPYYPPQQHPQAGAGPSPKRPRQTPPGHMAGMGNTLSATAVAGQDMSIDEEEDTSRGDLLDHLTPREISMMRYRQHHEWMEEILSSPYSIGQIVPVELGLGLKGELEPFTRGFFEAPTDEAPRSEGSPARVGKMEPGKADEFRRRAAQKLTDMNVEIERMKRKQAKRMGMLKRGTAVNEGEKRLRNAVSDPTSTGTEPWRLEGREEEEIDVEGLEVDTTEREPKERVDDIVKEVEQEVKRDIGVTPLLYCVQRGGLEEKPASEVDEDRDFTDASRPLKDQAENDDTSMNDSPVADIDGFGLTSRPPPQSGLVPPQPPTVAVSQSPNSNPAESNEAPPRQPSIADAIADQPQPASSDQISADVNQTLPQLSEMEGDVEMGGVSDENPRDSGNGDNLAGGDWVMVGKDGTSDTQASTATHTNVPDGQNDVPLSTETPGAFINTPGDEIQALTTSETAVATEQDTTGGLDPSQFDDFGNLDTAGDALAGFGEGGDLSLDDHTGLDLDDSAFGDAFHGTEMNPDGNVQDEHGQ
ncbi:MAG: hypothetical protein M1837_006100 [Sclerophora amabilis]|nr:MAG: hypothetical protein M1837_006100 [Sclerophora amabilis]